MENLGLIINPKISSKTSPLPPSPRDHNPNTSPAFPDCGSRPKKVWNSLPSTLIIGPWLNPCSALSL